MPMPMSRRVRRTSCWNKWLHREVCRASFGRGMGVNITAQITTLVMIMMMIIATTTILLLLQQQQLLLLIMIMIIIIMIIISITIIAMINVVIAIQARELKSVYVDVSAQFLRILLHKCHVNRRPSCVYTMYIYIYIHMCVYIYICIYVHT